MGGAGGVATLLSNYQRESGISSRVYSVVPTDLRSAPLAKPLHTLRAGLDEYLVKSRNFSSPISLLRDSGAGVALTSLCRAEVVHLHGVNGAIQMEQLRQIPKKTHIVWTLHDMNPFTGACHYSLGCEGFRGNCESCPAVRSQFRQAVTRHLVSQRSNLQSLTNLTLVSPSAWLASQASSSSTFINSTIQIIPNPVNPVFFMSGHSPAADGTLRLVVVAKNLSDPVKRVELAVRAFRKHRLSNSDSTLFLIGMGGQEFNGDGIVHLGPQPQTRLAEILASTDALIVPSSAENAPLVVAEAAAAGCQPVCADVGGMSEMMNSLGENLKFSTEGDLVTQLGFLALQGAPDRLSRRRSLAAKASEVFSLDAVAQKYDRVYAMNPGDLDRKSKDPKV